MKQISESSLLKFEDLTLSGQRLGAQMAELQGQLKRAECDVREHIVAMRKESDAPSHFLFNQNTREFQAQPSQSAQVAQVSGPNVTRMPLHRRANRK